jgi:uncharacterized membrane protein YgcG
MTTRRRFLVTSVSAVLAGGPALAQQDAATRSVVRQLEAQGFVVYSVRTTLLGRVRVLSRRGDLRREIVFDPRNGTILRDFTVDDGGAPSIGPEPDSDERSTFGSSGGDDDDDDGDRGDDNDRDGGGSAADNDGGSGGGGGSGSGGGSTGGGDDDDDDGGGDDDDDGGGDDDDDGGDDDDDD